MCNNYYNYGGGYYNYGGGFGSGVYGYPGSYGYPYAASYSGGCGFNQGFNTFNPNSCQCLQQGFQQGYWTGRNSVSGCC